MMAAVAFGMSVVLCLVTAGLCLAAWRLHGRQERLAEHIIENIEPRIEALADFARDEQERKQRVMNTRYMNRSNAHG